MKPFILFLLTTVAVAAAPLQKDLGEGLLYFRVHHLPADLPAEQALKGRSCVLDVRYVHADRAGAGALTAWLKTHAAVKSPVFLLANDETSPVLVAPVAKADAVPGLVVIAPAAARFASDISVPVSSRREKSAYDALEAGTPVDVLLDDNPAKARNDEARLARDHISDEQMAAQSDEAPLTDAPSPPRRLIDPELQRAVQLHRALLALRRL